MAELTDNKCLDACKRPGPIPRLSKTEKIHLAETVRHSYEIQRMQLVVLRQIAVLSHVSDSTVLRASHERGAKAYREELKFILTTNSIAIWKVPKPEAWVHVGFLRRLHRVSLVRGCQLSALSLACPDTRDFLQKHTIQPANSAPVNPTIP